MDQCKWSGTAISGSKYINVKKTSSKTKSRVWFQNKSSWLNDQIWLNENDNKIALNVLLNQDEQQQPMVSKSSNPKENICPVCNEDFKEITKEEETSNNKNKILFDVYEKIYLLNAIRPHGFGTNAYHPLCYDDANKQRLCLMSSLLRPFLKN